MKRSYTSLLRIIDLGLLLLMAFFAVADLSEDIHVTLPDDRLSEPGSVYRIVFDASMHMRLEQLPGRGLVCQARGVADMLECLQQFSTSSFLLAPTGTATLQQMIQVLDICSSAKALCVIHP